MATDADKQSEWWDEIVCMHGEWSEEKSRSLSKVAKGEQKKARHDPIHFGMSPENRGKKEHTRQIHIRRRSILKALFRCVRVSLPLSVHVLLSDSDVESTPLAPVWRWVRCPSCGPGGSGSCSCSGTRYCQTPSRPRRSCSPGCPKSTG